MPAEKMRRRLDGYHDTDGIIRGVQLKDGQEASEAASTTFECGRARSHVPAGGTPALVRLADRQVVSPWRKGRNPGL